MFDDLDSKIERECVRVRLLQELEFIRKGQWKFLYGSIFLSISKKLSVLLHLDWSNSNQIRIAM